MNQESRGQRTWIRFSGIGFEFVAAVAGFTVVGYFVDRYYDSSPWFVLTGLVLGMVGGMYNMIRQSLIAAKQAGQEDAEAKREKLRVKPDAEDDGAR